MYEREDVGEAWPMRPWIMAALCALAGLIFDLLTDYPTGGLARPGQTAMATFIAVATLSFVLTVEKRRWSWAAGFAIAWGAVTALVGWFSASYNSTPTIFEWPFFSGLFAVLLAAPLFQTVRDEGAWRFPYPRLHRHVWVDAVIGAASLFFTGLSFALAWLIAGLFSIIGVDLLVDALQESAFAWMLAGFAFGGAAGLLREREALLSTLFRLVTTILSVLAPVLAAALLIFLLSLPFTGLGELWESDVPATPMLLLAGAGAFALANAVIGDGQEGDARTRLLHVSALALVLAILPLAVVAALSIGQRIGQYGWTPERIWGVLAVAVAMVYGLAGWWAAARGRLAFDNLLRPLQTKLALGLCGLALFLALPIVDFGAISARSQLARLGGGKVAPAEFDWRAMAFEFGPAGRRRLAEIARSGPAELRNLASTALHTKDRYEVAPAVEAATSAPLVQRNLRVEPGGIAVPEGVRTVIERSRFCRTESCVLVMLDEREAILVGRTSSESAIQTLRLGRHGNGGAWTEQDYSNSSLPPATPESKASPAPAPKSRPDVAIGEVEVREVTRRQVFVDGEPIGDVFE